MNATTDNIKIQATLRQLEQPICKKKLIRVAWYHDGPDELQTVRYWIAEYSLSRAKERIEKLKEYVAIPEVYRTANIQGLYREFTNHNITLQLIE
ncbi:unnamed protein product [Rotaria socialis]